MRSFIKILIIILILFLAILGMTPYFLGGQLEHTFKQTVVETNKALPLGNITVTSYKRHWFGANATVNVSIKGTQPVEFSLPVDIKHGPIMMLPTGLAFGLGAFMIDKQSPELKGNIGVQLNFTGKHQAFGHIKQANISKNGLTFKLSHLDMQLSMTNQHLAIKNITVQTPTSEKVKHPILITIDNIAFKKAGKVSAISNSLLGQSKLSIQSIHATEVGGDKNKKDLTIKQLSINGDAKLIENNKTLLITPQYRIDSIQIGSEIIEPLILNTQIDLNASAFGKLIEQAKAINAQPVAKQDPSSLVPHMISLLNQGLSFKITKLYVGLPQSMASSALSATADLTLDPNTAGNTILSNSKIKPDTAVAGMMLAGDQKLRGATTFKASLTIPKSMVMSFLKSDNSKAIHSLIEQQNTHQQPKAFTPDELYQGMIDLKAIKPTANPQAVSIDIDYQDNKLSINHSDFMSKVISAIQGKEKAKQNSPISSDQSPHSQQDLTNSTNTLQ